MFLEAQPHLALSTRLNYSKALAATATRLGIDHPLLSLYASAQLAAGGGMATRQAQAAEWHQVEALIEIALPSQPRLALALFIAWKSCSRWGDIALLTQTSFLFVTPQRWCIEWPATIKHRRPGQDTVSGWVVLEETPSSTSAPMLSRLTPLLLAFVRSPQPAPNAHRLLSPLSTEHLNKWLKQRHLASLRKLSAHSFKRGSYGVLIAAAAANRVDMRKIALVAKHKDKLHDFPQCSLRYAPNKVDLALALGTQEATRWL